jgi:hypothetical protein
VPLSAVSRHLMPLQSVSVCSILDMPNTNTDRLWSWSGSVSGERTKQIGVGAMIRTGLAALTVLNAGSLHPFSMMRLLVDATTNPSIIMRIAIKGNNHERN